MHTIHTTTTTCHNTHHQIDRFPARPYILEGNPSNITIRVNETAIFNCPTITDIAAHITWAKYRAANDSDGNDAPDASKLEVFVCFYPGVVLEANGESGGWVN